MTRTALGLLLVPLLLFAGTPAMPGDDPPPEKPVKSATRPAPAVPGLRLIEKGAEARRKLRYALSSGRSETVTLAVKGTVRIESGTPSPRILEVPTVSAKLALTTGTAMEGGRYPLTLRLESVDVPRAAGEKQPDLGPLEREAKRWTDRALTAVVTPQGILSAVRLGDVDDAGALVHPVVEALRAAICPVLPALPAEPVGKGERWEVTTRPPIPGVPVTQKTEYEITAFEDEGKTVRLTVRISHAVPLGRLRLNKAPPGVVAYLREFECGGTGTLVLRLGRMVHDFDLRLRGAATISVVSPAGIQNVKATATVETEARRAD
jgi:hypothetical protein